MKQRNQRSQRGKLIGGIALGLCVLLAGCNRTGDIPRPTTTSVTPGPDGKSVALPPSQMPASEASTPPVSPAATTTSNDEKQSQGVAKNLSKQQESTGMPMAGQVNNHSVPDTSGAKQ
jgi:hypothetical protein